MRCKRIFGLALSFILAVSAYAQTSLNDIYDCYFIKLEKSDKKAKIPFQAVIITDERPDTAKGGYYYPGDKDRGIRKICFENGARNQVSSFLDSYMECDKQSETSVLICIKKIWFGTYDTTDIKENKLPLRTRKLILKFEIYLNNQTCYYPLYRFDSTFNMNRLPDRDPSYTLANALVASMRKLVAAIPSNYQNRQCLSRQQIDSFNSTHKLFPVLQEGIARKGVYMTLAQFKENQPAYKDFTIHFRKSEDILFIPGKDIKDSLIKNAWGLCDGKKMYVKMGKNYFAISKSGSNYDFHGFDTFYKTSVSNPYTTPLGVWALNAANDKTNRSKPFQLNLETGEIY